MSSQKPLPYSFKEHRIMLLTEDESYRKEELEKVIIPIFLKKLPDICPKFLNRHFDAEDISSILSGKIPIGWTIYVQKPLSWGGTAIAKEVFDQITNIQTSFEPISSKTPKNLRLKTFSYQLSTYINSIQKKGRRNFFFQFSKMFKEHLVLMKKSNAYLLEKDYIRPLQKQMHMTDLTGCIVSLPCFTTPIYTPEDFINRSEEFGEKMQPLLKRTCRWTIPIHNLKEGSAHHVRKWRSMMQECDDLPAQLRAHILERIK